MTVRTLVIWCADWPVLALGRSAERPAAVLQANRVVAATEAARVEGVTVGMGRRDAQRRCPSMEILERDLDREARAFEPVVAVASSFTPWVEQSWPGSCALPTRGPSRYFGGDEALATAVQARVEEALALQAGRSQVAVQVGVADGSFAARLAARAADPTMVVGPGQSAAFLAPLPLSVLPYPALVDVLQRLGLDTLGELAALAPAAVLGRFARPGQVAQRLAQGFDDQPLDARPPPVDLSVTMELDPPVERIDQAAFAAKSLADRLWSVLDDAGWSCLRLAVEAETEYGEQLLRLWRHEGGLTPGAMAERVRWQLEGWLTDGPARQPTGGLTRLSLVPDQVLPARGRQLGFWGGQSEAAGRAARAASRVAALLGPEAVQVVQRRGGRGPGEQFCLLAATAVDLVERANQPLAPLAVPWPGHLPIPSPAMVWDDKDRPHARLQDGTGAPVRVSGRGELGHDPHQLWVQGWSDPVVVAAWSGPWPVEERWWDGANHRRLARLQIVLEDGSAWLLVLQGGQWWVGARYD